MGIRFGIDIDGTVTSPFSIISQINKDFHMQLTMEDITEYELTPFVNATPEEFSKWFKETEATIYRDSPIFEGAKEILNKWEKEHELIFISARGNNMLGVTEGWLDKHQIHYDHIELIGSHDKIDAAKKLQVNLFLEDKHDNAVMISEACNIPVLLFDTPYNRKPIPENVIRVYTWEEADQWVTNWLQTRK
ncbi:hypothetical protein OEV98_10000 [Caldibacillus lycopersici]|uniref:Nucleotidase n=1 Tax=Perspicuibacillus lycopersici TaxID=1325689 RepID=A0AAE3ITI2_9BACI|nr:hypothetical protein [Perspicuibacillus lycopersici]MCU9613892.1 hypothetical protein [Perspicuibacillus lycopersici]